LTPTGNDVDTTELLAEHNDERSERGTRVARNCKQLEDLETTPLNLLLLVEQHADHEEVTRGLDFVVSKSDKRLVCVIITPLADEPSRRLGTEKDLEQKDECRYTCGGKPMTFR
jgi:hypothetical protein